MIALLGGISIAGCGTSRDSLAQSSDQSKIDLALQKHSANDLHGADALLTELLAEYQSDFGNNHVEAANALGILAGIRDDLGLYESSESLYEQALDMYRRLYKGEDHEDIAHTLGMLASVQDDLRNYRSAESLYEQALDMYRRLNQEEDHEKIAHTLGMLAFVRGTRLDRPAEAEPLYEEALSIRQRLYHDQDHPDIARSLRSLASVRSKLRDYRSAESLYEQALDMYRRFYQGEDHDDIAHTLGMLASVQDDLRNYRSAESLSDQALGMYRRLYQGEDHEDIARTLGMLAFVRGTRLDRPAEAEPLYEEALSIRQRLYHDQDHPDIARSLHSLASVRGKLRAYRSAESLYEQALDMYRRLYKGEDHEDIAHTLSMLASVQEDLGDYRSAESLYNQSLEMRRRLHADQDHEDIAHTFGMLASAQGKVGNYGSAESLYVHALSMHRRLFQLEGVEDHPDIALSLNNLAHVRLALGRASEAEALDKEALAMRRRLFQTDGVGDHPDIASSLNNLAEVFQALGRTAEAEPLHEEALAMRRRLFQVNGVEDHPNIAISLNNLAGVRDDLGRTSEADALYEEALAMCRRLYQTDGVGDHPDIARGLNNLAYVRQYLGRADDAVPLYNESLDMYRRLYQTGGVGDHPDLLRSLGNLAWLIDISQPVRAEELYSEALSMADRMRLATRGDVESRALMAGKLRLPWIAHWLGRVRLSLGRPLDAFAALETGRARSLMDLFELEHKGGLDAVISEIKDDRQRQRVEQARASEDARRLETAEAEALLAASAHRTDLTDEDREQLRQDAVRARTGLGDAVAATGMALGRAFPATRAQNPAELRAALLPGELVVAFGWDGNDAYLLTLDNRGADGAILFDGMDGRKDRVATLRTDLESFAASLRGPDVEHDPAVALSLAHALIPERLRSRVSNADRLIVVTTGPLSRVPMDLILSSLNEQAGIVQAHSALQYIERRDEALRRTMARRRARTIEADAAVVLARPQYAGSPPELPTYELALADADFASRSRNASRALDAYRLMEARLTDLPGTQTEAMVIAASLDAAGLAEGERRVTLLGPDASIPRLMGEVERLRPRVLHIATHGIIGSAEDPLDAALALTPGPDDHGFLTLDGLIRQWPGLLEDTDLVVLSACDTGWGATKGDAEFGLPWGFFLSGATSVVASLWQVDDVSTALLMARFHEGRLGSFEEPRTIRGRTFRPGTRMTTLDALDEAKHWLRTLTREEVNAVLAGHRGTVPEEGSEQPPVLDSPYPYEHPYYWAAFVLLGSTE